VNHRNHSENDTTSLPSFITGGKIWVNGCNPDKKKIVTMKDITTYTKQ
jgi:hypothetical protein